MHAVHAAGSAVVHEQPTQQQQHIRSKSLSIPTTTAPFISNLTSAGAGSGKENSTAAGGMHHMYAPASGGYFGVQAPLGPASGVQPLQPSSFGLPLGAMNKASARGATTEQQQQSSSVGRRAAAAAKTAAASGSVTARGVSSGSSAGLASAPPSVRELGGGGAHNSSAMSSNNLLKEVAAMRRAAAAAAAAGVPPQTSSVSGLSVAGLAPSLQQQQQHAGNAAKKVPVPPEGRASRPTVSSGSAGTAALGNNSSAAQRRRTGGPNSAATVAAQQQFDQYSLWNDAEPSAQEWARRQQQQPSSGRAHQLYPQPGSSATATAAAPAQPFTARPDANFHVPSHHRSTADAAAAARVSERAAYGSAHSKHGPNSAAAGDLSGLSALDATRANERVEKRFLYWKNFWSNIQAMRNGKGGADPLTQIPLPDMPADMAALPHSGSQGRSSGATAATAHGAASKAAPSAAALLGMDEASFRRAMAEYAQQQQHHDEPEVEISHSGDPRGEAFRNAAPAPAASQKQRQASPPGPQRTHTFVPSGAGATSAATAPAAAAAPAPATSSAQYAANYAAFQAYQEQMASGGSGSKFSSPAKKHSAAAGGADDRTQQRPPSASKATAAAQAAKATLAKHQEREKGAAVREAAATAAAAANIAHPQQAPPPPAASHAHKAESKPATSSTAAAAPATSSSSTAAADAAAAAAEAKRLSNVERFWAEEQARAGKPRVHAGAAGGGSKSKAQRAHKAAAHFVAPADTDNAKDMWRNMKKDLDDKWIKFAAGGSASPTASDEASASPPAAAAPAPAPATAAAEESNSRRSTAYAFTNIRKEDLKYQPAPAAAQPASAAAAQPSTARSTGASNGSGGAQFSSFTRPPQPHTHTHTSTSSASSASTQHTSTSSAAYAAALATATAAGQGGAFEILARWGVRELRRELLGHPGVTPAEVARLVEKEELVMRLLVAQAEATRRENARKAAAEIEASRENTRERIIQEVDRWAKGRGIKSMLNELHGFGSSPEAPGYLHRSDTFAAVQKSYRKALLRIHPDKHMASTGGIHDSKYLRATEVFKYVSQAFDEYKKKHDK